MAKKQIVCFFKIRIKFLNLKSKYSEILNSKNINMKFEISILKSVFTFEKKSYNLKTISVKSSVSNKNSNM